MDGHLTCFFVLNPVTSFTDSSTCFTRTIHLGQEPSCPSWHTVQHTCGPHVRSSWSRDRVLGVCFLKILRGAVSWIVVKEKRCETRKRFFKNTQWWSGHFWTAWWQGPWDCAWSSIVWSRVPHDILDNRNTPSCHSEKFLDHIAINATHVSCQNDNSFNLHFSWRFDAQDSELPSFEALAWFETPGSWYILRAKVQ